LKWNHLVERLNKFWQLTGYERFLLLEASFWLGVSRLAILTVPFRRITPYLGRHMACSPEKIDLESRETARRIAWAVNTAGRHLPWECRCLAQAVTGKWMLRRRGIPATLYLGLAKDDAKQLNAHAWLRSGDVILTGREEINRFTVISTFA